ncbi:MAG: sulfatase [Cyclobacteriaceae bacterium]
MKTNLYLFIAVMAFSGFFSCQPPDRQKPNVLMICIDDLNDWVGCMDGNPSAITPNIDRLASQGTLFTNAHCQTALCGPSRASIMSGLRPSTTGIYGQINDQDLRTASDAMSGIKFLPEYFADNGYKTMGVGKIFHGHAPEGAFQVSGGREKGFGPKPADGKHFHWNQEGTSTDWGAFPDTDEKMPDYNTANWAIERLNEKHDKPFFLTVGFLRPHVPWYVPQKWFDLHPLDKVKVPPYKEDDKADLPEIARQIDELPMMPTTDWAIESEQWKNIVQGYLASTSFVDFYVGEVLKALENSPYKDNTIVVLWSDHGYRLGEKGTFAKHCLWQEGTNVPLIVKTPGGKGGLKSHKPVELLDIYPTLIDLCDLPQNTKNEGRSFKSLVTNPSDTWDDVAITTFGRNNHAIVTGQYRYISYENGAEELYNRTDDPNEWDNLAEKAESGELKAALRKHLPANNAPWSSASSMKHNEYFRSSMSQLSASK